MAAQGNATAPAQRPVQVKLVLLGEAAVGKSSVVLRFVQNDFQENKEPTIGAAFLTQKCRLEDKVIKFEIWDTAGQERFHSLAPMYYRNAQAAVVAYDVTKGPSLDKAKSWVKELQRQANPNIVIALIGNKVDLVQPESSSSSSTPADAQTSDDSDGDSEPDDATATPTEAANKPKPASSAGGSSSSSSSKRQVPREEAEAYAQEAGLLFFETSAKSGEGVVEVFTEIAKKIPLEHILSSTGGSRAASGQAGGGRNAAAGGAGGGQQGGNQSGRVRLGGQGEGEGDGSKGCAC